MSGNEIAGVAIFVLAIVSLVSCVTLSRIGSRRIAEDSWQYNVLSAAVFGLFLAFFALVVISFVVFYHPH